MIFTKEHAQMVVDRRKGQTRRPVKPGDYGILGKGTDQIVKVRGRWGRLKWQVGQDYAAQPGRGKKSIGRTPPIVEIRRERLQEIHYLDFTKEGAPQEGIGGAWIMQLFWFMELWDSLYRKPWRWENNPEVWVLVFEDQILSAGKMTDLEPLSATSLDRIARREGLTYSNMERFSKENWEGE